MEYKVYIQGYGTRGTGSKQYFTIYNLFIYFGHKWLIALLGILHSVVPNWPSLLIAHAHVFILCIIMHYSVYFYCYYCMLFVIVVSSSSFSGSDLFTSLFVVFFPIRIVFTLHSLLVWRILPGLEWLHYKGIKKLKCSYSSFFILHKT